MSHWRSPSGRLRRADAGEPLGEPQLTSKSTSSGRGPVRTRRLRSKCPRRPARSPLQLLECKPRFTGLVPLGVRVAFYIPTWEEKFASYSFRVLLFQPVRRKAKKI